MRIILDTGRHYGTRKVSEETEMTGLVTYAEEMTREILNKSHGNSLMRQIHSAI